VSTGLQTSEDGVARLLQSMRDGALLSYYFFWGHRASAGQSVGKWCLSQWWTAPFAVDGITYPTAEHFMMAGKARLFGDETAVGKILATPDPGVAKKHGRAVRGFEEAAWTAARFPLVVAGNTAKFRQHPRLGSFLLSTGEDVLVEASPLDTIWGIGLTHDSPDARSPERWRGLNLLGFALMDVRAGLRAR
jgi:ribA/ribD-fused uncharacterized protein